MSASILIMIRETHAAPKAKETDKYKKYYFIYHDIVLFHFVSISSCSQSLYVRGRVEEPTDYSS